MTLSVGSGPGISENKCPIVPGSGAGRPGTPLLGDGVLFQQLGLIVAQFLFFGRLVMAIISVLAGYKTYIAAAGFVGLAVYQLSQGEVNPALQSVLSALTAVGLRSAIAKAQA